MALEVLKYEDKYEARWDRLVLKNSTNGTFLQTRNFLNYHPKARFTDASVMIMQGSSIVAVIPACDVIDEGKRCFYSHKGSTFGGIVIDDSKYNISILDELIPLLDDYLKDEGYEKILLKSTSNLFTDRAMDLMDYYLFKNGYEQFNELSFYVDVENASEDLLSTLSSSRRRDYKYSLKNDLIFRKLKDDAEIAEFYEILVKNLKKHDVVPIHTLSELIEFKYQRLVNEVEFYGVFYEEKLVAGTMIFIFGNKVLHTQYLASDLNYSKMFLMDFLNFNLIQLTRRMKMKYFSFGISTEERGKVLNKGLSLFKEGFGCDYSVNRSYIKKLEN